VGGRPRPRRAGSSNTTSNQHEPSRLVGHPELMADTQETLISWLDAHRDALVGAVNPSGEAVEMPASIPLGREQQIESRSLLELVVPGDSRAVTEAFVAALARGIGVAKIHLCSDPGESWLLQYLDLRERHGVILRMVVRGEDFDDEHGSHAAPRDLTSARPRLCVMQKSEVAEIVTIDKATTLMLGWSPDEMIGHSTLDFIHPDDHVRAIDNWMSRFAGERGQGIHAVRLRYMCKDGNWIWIETSNDFQTREDGSTVVESQLIDVSEEMSAIDALRHSEQFLRRVTESVPVGLFHIAADRSVAFVNPVLTDLLGDGPFASCGELAGAMSDDGNLLVDAIDRVMIDGADADLGLALSGTAGRSAMVTLRAVIHDGVVLGVLGCVVDVTELKTLADTDVLTGLQNRRSIVGLLEAELIRHSGRVSVIFADLDGFKQINDHYGHQVGDRLLAEVAARLSSALRPGDRIGRLGGDEFLIFCPGVTDAKAANAIASRLRSALEEEFRLPEATLRVVASVGVACGGPGATVDDLISRSDAAMYASKLKESVSPQVSA
jgi:diguanylate cyclase (GGDEF)-like protein/PAS domain S-box-containing protein